MILRDGGARRLGPEAGDGASSRDTDKAQTALGMAKGRGRQQVQQTASSRSAEHRHLVEGEAWMGLDCNGLGEPRDGTWSQSLSVVLDLLLSNQGPQFTPLLGEGERNHPIHHSAARKATVTSTW